MKTILRICLLLTMFWAVEPKLCYCNVTDSVLLELYRDRLETGKSITKVANRTERIFKTYLDDSSKHNINISNVVSYLISIIAIGWTTINIKTQKKYNEQIALKTHYRSWSTNLIGFISEYIMEIQKNKSIYANTILKGKAVSDIQGVLEVKIELLLDESIDSEKKLIYTIKSYQSNAINNQNFNINVWLNSIKDITKNCLKNKN